MNALELKKSKDKLIKAISDLEHTATVLSTSPLGRDLFMLRLLRAA